MTRRFTYVIAITAFVVLLLSSIAVGVLNRPDTLGQEPYNSDSVQIERKSMNETNEEADLLLLDTENETATTTNTSESLKRLTPIDPDKLIRDPEAGSSLEVIGRQPDIIGPAAEQCRPAFENAFEEILKTDAYSEFSYLSEQLGEVYCNDVHVVIPGIPYNHVAYVLRSDPERAYFNPAAYANLEDYYNLASTLFHEARHIEQHKECNFLKAISKVPISEWDKSWFKLKCMSQEERERDAKVFEREEIDKIFPDPKDPVTIVVTPDDVVILSNSTETITPKFAPETVEVPSSQRDSEEGFTITLPLGVSWQEYEKWQSERQNCYKQHGLEEAPAVLIGTVDPNDGYEDEIEREERLLNECGVKPLEEYAADDVLSLPPITIENYKGDSARMLPYKQDEVIDEFETIDLAMHEPLTIKIGKGSQYREVVMVSEEEQCCEPNAFVNLPVNESSQASAVYNGAPYPIGTYSYENRTELAYFLTHRPVDLPQGQRMIPIGEHGIYISIEFTDGSHVLYAINADIAPPLHK